MIEVNNLHVSYGNVRALEGISLKVERNATCAIIGPSGCGKTTLLYTLAGLIHPEEGTIYIAVKAFRHRRSHRNNTEDYGLFPWKNVWNNVALGLQVRGKTKRKNQ